MKNKYDWLDAVDSLLVLERSNLLHLLAPLNPAPSAATNRGETLAQIGELTVLLSEVREHKANLYELENICYRQADPELSYPEEQLYGELITHLTLGLLPCLSLSPDLVAYVEGIREKNQAILARLRDEQLALINPDSATGRYEQVRQETWIRRHGLDHEAAHQRCERAIHGLCMAFPKDMQHLLALAQTQGDFATIFALLD